ncbi:TetR/AcrR family transcriptional regulator C-terminal domain-containing protein [Sphaerisporangium flaviroseum]|uniref:TetR/AcrR family transcriptional regulator C-terminal domain-containing protein n=1 Tax=Sphaerisporangium flaviroseum TaxID=509199 RepID=A0ABP7IK68_9ACTN
MVVFAGQGDARRSMALLWRTPGSGGARSGPGPKPGLTVDEIVDAAIAVADAEGMAALSMRAVGERLGRTAMALYTYVPSKSELVDLMYDRALAEMPTAYDLGAGWRAAVTAWAEDGWSFYLRHPWVLQVSQARPVLGPNEYVSLETTLRILRATGLEAGVLRRLVGALVHFVRGAARTIAETRQAPAATGVSDEEWWYARSALLLEVVPDFTERFPMVAWLGAEAQDQPGDASVPYLEREAKATFKVGLTVLLDGIEAIIGRSGHLAGPTRPLGPPGG